MTFPILLKCHFCGRPAQDTLPVVVEGAKVDVCRICYSAIHTISKIPPPLSSHHAHGHAHTPDERITDYDYKP